MQPRPVHRSVCTMVRCTATPATRRRIGPRRRVHPTVRWVSTPSMKPLGPGIHSKRCHEMMCWPPFTAFFGFLPANSVVRNRVNTAWTPREHRSWLHQASVLTPHLGPGVRHTSPLPPVHKCVTVKTQTLREPLGAESTLLVEPTLLSQCWVQVGKEEGIF